MTRNKSAIAIVMSWAAIGHADDAKQPEPPPEPDPRAIEVAEDANLVTKAPREGYVTAVAGGFGITLGDGVGRGPGLSFRVGHVATPRWILTFELTAGSLLHEPMGGGLRTNATGNVMVGGQYYVNTSFWIRGAGGLTTYTVDDPGQSARPHGGVGAIVGVGLDLFRWRYLVFGIETFSSASIVATRGLLVNSNLGFGLTYY